MYDRRVEPRILCADLVDLQWRDAEGRTRRVVANLEDISLSGACVQVDRAVPLKTVVRIRHAKGELSGTVRYCVYREIGYFLGIEFESGSRWNMEDFRPQHMLDPRKLMDNKNGKPKPTPPVTVIA